MSTVSSQLALGIPSLCLPRLGMQAGHHAYLVLCVVSGDLNAGPPPPPLTHTWRASLSTIEQSPAKALSLLCAAFDLHSHLPRYILCPF